MKLFGQSSKLGSIATPLGHNANAANAHNAVVFRTLARNRHCRATRLTVRLTSVLRRVRREPIVALAMRHQVPAINHWRE